MRYKSILIFLLLTLLPYFAVAQNGNPIVFDYITNLQCDRVNSFSEGLAPVKLKGKWGYIDRNGALIIPAQYDDAGGFSEGLAPVKLKGKWGYIDRNGTWRLPNPQSARVQSRRD